MKIVIAEDDELIRKTIQLRLLKDGHEVVCCENGLVALEQIEKIRPQLIISDIMMPYVTGLEIVGTVKQSYTPEIPIIILSGMGQEEIVLEAFQLGADDFITKPFSPNELSLRVKRFSQRQK
ncbi:response regulator [Pedobacter changchengzhani]|uniref:Response regulator n=1 Tax=Pedobacter changchengzhani TaxID=2529274 RepID=A0A4R5MKK8_9SPHI|nr:response regulator transcription factor [Pedobacter changchengzhani]TDG36128.1 response regulator [Pedobacter changchengzhani]